MAPGSDPAATRGALIGALTEIARRHRVSSVHATFCTAEEADAFAAAGWLVRHGMQYHWDNRGYASFDDFLGALSHGGARPSAASAAMSPAWALSSKC